MEQQFQKDLAEMKGMVNKMYYALLGNDIAKDGGLVGRIETLEKISEEMKDGYRKITIMHKVLLAMAGIIGGSLGTYIISLFIHK